MDEKDYELLHALDETRNITHAADKLYMTQSALSMYAQYFLDHMDDRSAAPLLLSATRLLHHLGNIFREQEPPPRSGGMRIAVDRKLLQKIREKKTARGHKWDDHEPSMSL